jgi:hypothetical protein
VTGAVSSQAPRPALTWGWEYGRCVIRVDGKAVADGATMAEALQALAEALRRAEREQEARS